MSIQAVFLIVAIVIIRAAALNKLPKTTFLVLWGVVLLRLLVPFSISTGLSVYNALPNNAVNGLIADAFSVPAMIFCTVIAFMIIQLTIKAFDFAASQQKYRRDNTPSGMR